MNIKNVNCLQTEQGKNLAKPFNLAFGATPQQILKVSDSMKLCPTQRSLLKDIGSFYAEAEQKLLKNLNISLTEANQFPKNISETDIKGFGFAKMNELIVDQFYTCASKSDCGACKSVKLGEYIKNLLSALNVEEPDKIVLNRKA